MEHSYYLVLPAEARKHIFKEPDASYSLKVFSIFFNSFQSDLTDLGRDRPGQTDLLLEIQHASLIKERSPFVFHVIRLLP